MGSTDERSFKANYTVEGLAKLRARVTDKLKEFMGDYTDDTLVEYVIVLLRNGRHREEAKNELHVFLGDDSDSFVTWLWDHLSSSLGLYVHIQDTNVDEVPKVLSVVAEHPGKDTSHQRDPQSGKGQISDNLSSVPLEKDVKGVVRDAFELHTFRSSIVGNIISEQRGHQRATHARSPSPQPLQHRKRGRHDEPQQQKRDAGSHPTISAPRRLLQFAVREAVGTSRQSTEENHVSSSMKRLRSVVATPNEALSIVDQPIAIKSVARVPKAMSNVVKAAQEAVADVRKVRPGRSVFDRLGRDMDVSVTKEQQVTQFRDDNAEGEYDEDCNQIQEHLHLHLNYIGAGDHVLGEKRLRMMASDTGYPSVSTSDGEGNHDVNGLAQGDSRTGISQVEIHAGNGVKKRVIPQQSGFMHVDDLMQLPGTGEQVVPASAPNNSRKVVNSSLNANTWKSPNYQEARNVPEMISRRTVQITEVKSGGQMIAETNFPAVVQNPIVEHAVDQKESQKALPSLPGAFATGRPLEDADFRTIYVSNVNFSATKDSLSRHFNKFGEVLKVIIVTDPGTGQPVGSAYIEFMRKEAADNALSLDGSTFLSRKLKVVKRSYAHQEVTPSMTWPHAARGPLYAASRFPTVAFSRGISGRYRSRFPVKPGARSMQWKRGDTQATVADTSAPPSGLGNLPQTPRGLTYIRTESRPDRSQDTT